MQSCGFSTTDWGLLTNARASKARVKLAASEILLRRCWRPVLLFIRSSGHDEETAKDLTPSFFADWIAHDVFGKADERKGRFRSFLLACLKRFVSNERRAENTQKRRPSNGLRSLDELMAKTSMPCEPVDRVTPEKIFDHAWACEVVLRVLRHLERECKETRKDVHCDILTHRIMSLLGSFFSAVTGRDVVEELERQ